MNRRRFIQTILGTPLLTPLLIASQKASQSSEFYLISDHPRMYFFQLLAALQNFSPPRQKVFSFLNSHPSQKDLSRLLMERGWSPAAHPMHSDLTVSFSQLRRKAHPSFTLVKNGKIWDIRTKKLKSVWQSMIRTDPQASLVTVATFTTKPPWIGAGQSISLFKDGSLIERLPLKGSWSRCFPTKQGPITVKMQEGRARIAESSCRHKICVATPPVSKAGERIICAPGHFLLEVQGRGVDTVIG